MLLKIKRKNPNWVEPTVSYDEIKIEDIERIMNEMAAETTRTVAISIGIEGLKAFDEAMKKHIGS